MFYYILFVVAPDRPKIYAEYKNDVGGDRQENYPQVPENIIAIDEGTQTLTLVCRVIGGKIIVNIHYTLLKTNILNQLFILSKIIA